MENWFGIIEAVFVFSLALAFYLWQRASLARDNRLAREREERQNAVSVEKGDREG